MNIARTLPVLSSRPVLGTFGKGIEGSATLNFSASGGEFCDGGCPHKGTVCYAERTESRPDRVQLVRKLLRHEMIGPEMVVRRAMAEIAQRGRLPWLRLSAQGSVPPAPTRGFCSALRALLLQCQRLSIPVHFPVETASKASQYRSIVRGLAVVRESAINEKRFLAAKSPVSGVGGTRDMSRLERVSYCKTLAALRTAATGRKCVVCPAVAARFLNHNTPQPRAKCGNCVACAQAGVDVVYPLH